MLPDDWRNEALCAGSDTENFFDKYELSQVAARETDRMCMSCPVVKGCFDYGVQTESYGVWGGVFLNEGRLDNVRNSHKSQEVWRALLPLIVDRDE